MEASLVRELNEEDIQQLKDLWLDALIDSRENVLEARKRNVKAEKNTTDEGDVKFMARYAKQGGLFSNALTGAEWIKYNHSMTTGVDAGLRISDHSILVECEKGDYTYKLVIYDNQFDDSPINGVYGIGKNLYNEDISNFDAKLIGEFITNLEEQRYDNKQTLERILRYYSRNVGYVLGRYNSKSGRFNKYGHKVSRNAKGSRQKTNGAGVSRGVGKTQINSDIRFSLRSNVEETKDLVAVHNLSEENLLKSLKLGGLPMPSIAIIKAKNGHNNFGDISLVFDKSTIGPKLSKYNKVFTSDAYTPTYPQIDYKIDSEVVEKGVDEVERLIKSKGYSKDDFGYLSSISGDNFRYGNTDEVANKTALKVGKFNLLVTC